MPPIRRSTTTRNPPLPAAEPLSNFDSNGRRIPRSPNAFMLFRTEKSPLVRQELEAELTRQAQEKGHDHHGVAPSQLTSWASKRIGQLWHSMSPGQKKVYFDRQAEKGREHKLMYPRYVFQPGKGGKKKKTPAAKKTRTTTRVKAATATVASKNNFEFSVPVAPLIASPPASVMPSLPCQIPYPTSDIRVQDATANAPVPHLESPVAYAASHLSLPRLSIPNGHYKLSALSSAPPSSTPTTSPSVSPVTPLGFQYLPWGLPPQDVYYDRLHDGGQPTVAYQDLNVYYPTEATHQQDAGYLTGPYSMNDKPQFSQHDDGYLTSPCSMNDQLQYPYTWNTEAAGPSTLIDQPANYQYPSSNPVAGPSSLVEELYGDGVIPLNDYDYNSTFDAVLSWNTEGPIPESAEVDLSFADINLLPKMYQEWVPSE